MVALLTAKKKKVRESIGILMPGGLVDINGAMLTLGLGENSLIKARRSGMVKPLYCGRKVFYDTTELIAWVKSNPDRDEE